MDLPVTRFIHSFPYGWAFCFQKLKPGEMTWVVQDCVLSAPWSQDASPRSPHSRARGPSNHHCSSRHLVGGWGRSGNLVTRGNHYREKWRYTLRFGRMLPSITEVVGGLEKNVLCYQRDLLNLICLHRLSWWSRGVWCNSGEWFPLGVRILYE